MTETKEEYLVDKKYGDKRVANTPKSPTEVAKEIVESIKGGHGGKRIAGEGKKIGRPDKGPDRRKAVTFKLPPLLVDKLRGEENQTGLIVRLLAEYYGVSEL